MDDVVMGLTALAVPLLDPAGHLRACISVSGLTPQMERDGETIYLERLQQACEELRPLLN